MDRKERYEGITEWFSRNMPTAESELHYDSPFHLLMAVILSAQCTDKRVNMHTPALFSRFPEPKDLAEASFEEVLQMIKSISFPNSKARHLIGMAQTLVRDFAGEVPSATEDLVRLPGVGRKTANVIASIVYDRPVIAVDTHVFRVSNRIGLAEAGDVLNTEKQLMARIPKENWAKAHHWLIYHGRQVCTARAPKCGLCPVADCCAERLGLNTPKKKTAAPAPKNKKEQSA